MAEQRETGSRWAERTETIGAALLAFLFAGVALRYEWLGIGPAAAFMYPAALFIGLFFGLIGVWAAREVAGAPGMTFWPALARVAALFTCFDAAAIFPLAPPIGSVVVPALAYVGLGLILFRRSGSRAVWVILITFLIKVISTTMLDATLYTLL